jgi:uncharacterized protein
MLLVDAGPLVAMADRRDRLHGAARELIAGEPGPLIVSAQVTAEADYLLRRRIGERAGEAFLEDLARGNFQVECLAVEEYERAAQLGRRHRDLGLGLTDLSLMVLAARLDCTRVATFDERHFRAVAPLQGGAFSVLPADA